RARPSAGSGASSPISITLRSMTNRNSPPGSAPSYCCAAVPTSPPPFGSPRCPSPRGAWPPATPSLYRPAPPSLCGCAPHARRRPVRPAPASRSPVISLESTESRMSQSAQEPYDFILAGGTLIDGSNAPRRVADVGVRGDRVAAVGDLAGQPARRRIDVAGKVVAPGCIDSHTHDDNYLLEHRDMAPKISQGVTTVVTGNCGISLAPLRHGSPPAALDLLDAGGSYRYARFSDYLDAL